VAESEAGPLQRLVSERAAFWVTDILSDPDARAYAFGSGSSLDFPFPVAVKTGTSQAYHDNWTIGYTREVTVGVWVGNFDRTPLRQSSGVTGAAPILHDVLLAAQRRVMGRLPVATDPPLARAPAGLAARSLCALSGKDAAPACPRVVTEWLPAATPSRMCGWHRQVHGRTVADWPPAYRAWARAQGLVSPLAERTVAHTSDRGESPNSRGTTARAASHAAATLLIVNPPAGTTYLRDPTLRAEFQTLPLRAVADTRARVLTWSVNGRVVGTSPPDGRVDWPLALGTHTIAVSDDKGRTDRSEILVK